MSRRRRVRILCFFLTGLLSLAGCRLYSNTNNTPNTTPSLKPLTLETLETNRGTVLPDGNKMTTMDTVHSANADTAVLQNHSSGDVPFEVQTDSFEFDYTRGARLHLSIDEAVLSKLTSRPAG